MQLIANQNITNATISLDGKFFENCTLNNCLIVLEEKEESGWAKTSFVNCEWRFIGAAYRLVHKMFLLKINPQEVFLTTLHEKKKDDEEESEESKVEESTKKILIN